MKQLLTFGLGYSAAALARLLTRRGDWRVTGTTRDAARAAAILQTGATPLIWPGDDAGVSAALDSADAILISVAPDRQGDAVLQAWGDRIAAVRPRWLGYLSSTNVYGDRGGDWVDEDTVPAPTTQRGQWRLAAEHGWQALADRHGLDLNIFRLAGIYGPGRGPFEKLRQGRAQLIVKPGQVFSRIHVDDIAQVLAASIDHGGSGIWNVCDDDPAPPQDVLTEAAKLAGLPIPPAQAFDTADLSPMARSFYAESKRVRNDRIKRELGVSLLYPDYRAGLRALIGE
ncbi:SDR family oxidoreductase [Paracoccus pacificus]|uniref:SDR family oxidoreductase n=1 Tax=Paracoccus pacificus TaxID=1463598 RepID=A0ABW4R2G7_9RHOB